MATPQRFTSGSSRASARRYAQDVINSVREAVPNVPIEFSAAGMQHLRLEPSAPQTKQDHGARIGITSLAFCFQGHPSKDTCIAF
eukprot:5413127-Amphidinium_carterae.1